MSGSDPETKETVPDYEAGWVWVVIPDGFAPVRVFYKFSELRDAVSNMGTHRIVRVRIEWHENGMVA